MDAGQYYITTITNAATKLGPVIFYLVVGYFLFIKLPFLLYFRTLKKPNHSNNNGQEAFETDQNFQKKMEEVRKREFAERMKNLGGQKKEERKEDKKEERKEERKEQKREDRSSQNKHNRQSKAGPKESPKSSVMEATPEEILFKLKPGQVFTGKELKKIYHQLLQESHPDKFRTDHQKEFAETKTKNINEAYQKLKKRVP